MGSRATGLKKIERLYGLLETMHATALQEAAALMHEAEAAIAVQGQVVRGARNDAHHAMGRGDRESYAVSDTERGVSERRRQRLEGLRQTREVARDEAREVYDASRVRRGQIKAVVDAAVAAEQLTEDRRAQMISDDRYLSRLRWSQLQSESE